MVDNSLFYTKLKKHSLSVVELFDDAKLFIPIPADWYIFVVDIENSTQAVADGFHHDVNLSATGSVVIVLNELKKINKDLNIPYFFGGDGTTFLVPYFLQKTIKTLFENYRKHIKETTGLNLKVGGIPIKEVYAVNKRIEIAKLALNRKLTIPIVLGTGLQFAEKKIKANFIEKSTNAKKNLSVNLTGMECRWQEIAPLKKEKKVFCLLATCPIDEYQIDVYREIMQKIITIFGDHHKRQPISSSKLHLDLSLKKIKKENLVRFGKQNYINLIKNWFITIVGKYYFKIFDGGKKYVNEISQLSHTLMIDGTINTVISGTQEKIDTFIIFLDELEKKGLIKYGIHITHASIMSCYVEDRKTNHVHFVDGTEGGFTSAAVMFKSKFE